jgi:hypothetical protein
VRNVATVHTGPLLMKTLYHSGQARHKDCQQIDKASRLRKDLGVQDRRDEREKLEIQFVHVAPFSRGSRFTRHGLRGCRGR